ncbi:hypothetical protein BpHYR1_049239 [Brachionus plicatilis]|uniref:Uncharacterized protein n=1 Tax=Brachionus plicatilis TaxID=10195 RepID=A0A3M7RX74_BRAPC|nr:hypothetical protein BpHYR1_049239 [Brachionus plicatilis]
MAYSPHGNEITHRPTTTTKSLVGHLMPLETASLTEKLLWSQMGFKWREFFKDFITSKIK